MKTYRHNRYEPDPIKFSADAYRQVGKNDVAWHILGWEVESDEDTEWTGQYVQTGSILAVMVGDDRVFTFDPEDLEPAEHYCGGCGQIGCMSDDREVTQ